MLLFSIGAHCFQINQLHNAGASPAAAQMVPGEIPPNDFRISFLGPDGDTSYFAKDSAAAYNAQRNEFLVVWEGTLKIGMVVPAQSEVFGQRVDATTGLLVGDVQRISFTGLDNDTKYAANRPAVAYNAVLDEFLVVWEGNEDTSVPNTNEYEIWGQRLTYNVFDSLVLSGDELRISNMGPDGDADYRAERPAVVHDSIKNQFLVVWDSDDDSTPMVNNDNEIFGQYLYYDGGVLTELEEDFRISQMGPDGNIKTAGFNPALGINQDEGDYLVVWSGIDNAEFAHTEIFGRLIEEDGSLEDQIKISDMGPANEPEVYAERPALAFNSQTSEWLVVWEGSQEIPMEMEIFGQFLYNSGPFVTLQGAPFPISDMGPAGDLSYYAIDPKVGFDPLREAFLVVWEGEDNTGSLNQAEIEIFGQLIGAYTRAEIGYNDFRLSDMGPDGDNNYEAHNPSVTYSSRNNSFLVTWDGDDDTPPLVEGEREIFGQRYTATPIIFLPVINR